MKRITGTYAQNLGRDETVKAFIPHPLPPDNPPLELEGELARLLTQANEKLQRLEVAGDLMPSIDLFVYAFVRKEAVLSSQIEGTQATLMDLFEVEASSDAPMDADVEEVCGYVDALNFAWDQLGREDGLPISMRLLSQTHELLLRGARGIDKQPGIVRTSQNWIGGTRPGNALFVPPPPQRLGELLSDFERAIHHDSELPPLIRVGLLHVQFETLHPYLDGNGRLGRLLITLLLRHWGLLTRPLLYLSLFLKAHRQEYYQRLSAVREQGDWEGWLKFFLEGVALVAEESIATARQLHSIIAESRSKLLKDAEATVPSIRLFELLPHHPLLNVNRVVELLNCSRPTASKAMTILENAGIVQPIDDRKRNKTVAFEAYLALLRQGTELNT